MIKSLYIKDLTKDTLNEEHDKIRKLLKVDLYYCDSML